MKKVFAGLLLSSCLISATPAIVDAPDLLNYAQQVANRQGPLRKTEEGLVYVKVPNAFILETLSLLPVEKIEAPACFGEGKVGAHITVIDSYETQGKKLKLPPTGTLFTFQVTNLCSIDITNEHGPKRIYMFTVRSPELEKIRTDNGLPPKIHGLDLHITAAVKYLPKKQEAGPITLIRS